MCVCLQLRLQVTQLKVRNARLVDLVTAHTDTVPSDLSRRKTKKFYNIQARVESYVELFINECGSQQMAVNFSEQVIAQLKVYMIITMI